MKLTADEEKVFITCSGHIQAMQACLHDLYGSDNVLVQEIAHILLHQCMPVSRTLSRLTSRIVVNQVNHSIPK